MELTYTLTTAQHNKWNTNPDWRDGFLEAMVLTVPPEAIHVVIADELGAELARYRRSWTAV